MLMMKERRPAIRTLRGWAISVLQEAGAIRGISHQRSNADTLMSRVCSFPQPPARHIGYQSLRHCGVGPCLEFAKVDRKLRQPSVQDCTIDLHLIVAAVNHVVLLSLVIPLSGEPPGRLVRT